MIVDYLIVEAGFSGAVCAERLAAAGLTCLLTDWRDHIGNAHDRVDRYGVLIHLRWPHIFHTNSERIFTYLCRFADWRVYEHRVLGSAHGKLVPLTINRTPLNELYGLDLDGVGALTFFERARQPCEVLRTSEDVVLNSVGGELFFRGYKQWDLVSWELSAGVATRISTRANDEDRYLTNRFQVMPDKGCTATLKRMLANERISVRLDEDFFEHRRTYDARHIIYTGPIDGFSDYRLGGLPCRSLSFQHEHLPACDRFQRTGTINFPDELAYTRITEFDDLTGQVHAGTPIVREFSQAEADPYYLIPRRGNEALYQRYMAIAEQTAGVTFVGRLAHYRSCNMDQIVGAALTATEALIERGPD